MTEYIIEQPWRTKAKLLNPLSNFPQKLLDGPSNFNKIDITSLLSMHYNT